MQTCPGCAGSGVTTRYRYETELDANGNQTMTARETVEPCSTCGGTGQVTG